MTDPDEEWERALAAWERLEREVDAQAKQEAPTLAPEAGGNDDSLERQLEAELDEGPAAAKAECAAVDAAAEQGDVCVHVHFGMSGAWATFDSSAEEVPEPTPTTRLRLEEIVDGEDATSKPSSGLVTHLSAMTVQHGLGRRLFETKRAALGEDPLRADADPQRLWTKVHKSRKGIGALIMDQSFFCGPGNIYRAEILFKAGVHPSVLGRDLSREQFDSVWEHSVSLLRRGFETGSILTVDPAEAKAWSHPTSRRRYIYNQQHCPRCEDTIVSWDIAGRTCYACLTCQRKPPAPDDAGAAAGEGATVKARRAAADNDAGAKPAQLFRSHCAGESLAARLAQGAAKLSVPELRQELAARGVSHSGMRKAALVLALDASMQPMDAAAAAAEKAAAGERVAVEHVAELAPSQTRTARRGVAVGEVQKRGAAVRQRRQRKRRRVGDPMRAGSVSSIEKPERNA